MNVDPDGVAGRMSAEDFRDALLGFQGRELTGMDAGRLRALRDAAPTPYLRDAAEQILRSVPAKARTEPLPAPDRSGLARGLARGQEAGQEEYQRIARAEDAYRHAAAPQPGT